MKSYDFDEKCRLFCDLLLEYNKIHNITGAKTKEDVYENIHDSIFPISFLQNPKTAIDIGTGAGFPGLILAMALEECTFYLIEPIAKRSSFLHLVKSKLHLKNVKIENKKIEHLKPFGVDLITSRAVADTKTLMKLCSNFKKEDTIMLFYKGENVENEIDESLNYKIIDRGLRRYLIVY